MAKILADSTLSQNFIRAASVIVFNVENRHVLMLHRSKVRAILPNTLVFPGGRFQAERAADFPADKSNAHLIDEHPITPTGFPDDLCYRVAILRELFVDLGLLLVYSANCRESRVVTTADDPDLKHWRIEVKRDPAKFAQLFMGADKADVNLLLPWSNWLTPHGHLDRLDKIFYVAPIQEDYTELHDSYAHGDHKVRWLHPTDIIAQNSKGLISVPVPQFYELARLRLACLEHLREHADSGRVVPQLISDPRTHVGCFVMPEDHLYNTQEAEHQQQRHLPADHLRPTKEIDRLRSIHRVTFDTRPHHYVRNELHMANLPKMPRKPHLFAYLGSDFHLTPPY